MSCQRRTIGLDKEALDAQVAEKQRRQAEEQAANKALDREMVRVEQHLKLMETEKQRAKRDMDIGMQHNSEVLEKVAVASFATGEFFKGSLKRGGGSMRKVR